MNENLEKALTELITKGLETAEHAGSFVLSELPDVVNQLLIWHGVESFLWFSFGFIILLICCVLHKVWGMLDDDLDAVFCGRFFTWAVGSTLSFVFITSNLTWLQIWLAPKVWLLEYASRIVK